MTTSDRPLTRDLLMAPEVTTLLGTLSKARLWEDGFVCLHFNSNQQVECVQLHEVQTDALPEAEAINCMLKRSYDQPALVAFLKGRDARLRLAKQG
jgi:hypothetical protein